jgi:hypothetical protein
MRRITTAGAACLLGFSIITSCFADERGDAIQPLAPLPLYHATDSKKTDTDACNCDTGFDFSKVPPTRIFPRLGFFPVLPSGPGYYSALDHIHHNCRKDPPKYAYPAYGLMAFSFFDADFRYLDSSDYKDRDFFDELHRIRLGDNWLFSSGGQAWWRYMNEHNSRLTGINNDYHLTRVRVYGDLWYQDKFRAYIEFIHADSIDPELAPLPIDVNRGDLLNAFFDIKVADISNYPAYLRVGRQELLLGSQRLISPLEWGNTRRTFQGVRMFRQGEKFDIDAFWLQPVPPNPNRFDSVDNNRNFAGLWTTYRPKKGHFFDNYYLFLDDTSNRVQRGLPLAPFNVHTLGTRYVGDKDNRYLWDFEAMLQLGEQGDQSIIAGNVTLGGGYHAKRLPMTPTFWVYYDYATGDNSPGVGGSYNTFNQLFAFGHYYMGWADLVGRQNIQDLNFHLYLYPTPWITFWTQFHHFELAQRRDALYNAAGVPIRRDPTGLSGVDVGNELDFVVNFHLGQHSDILLGYSHLFAGDFINATGPGGSASVFFAQYGFRW